MLRLFAVTTQTWLSASSVPPRSEKLSRDAHSVRYSYMKDDDCLKSLVANLALHSTEISSYICVQTRPWPHPLQRPKQFRLLAIPSTIRTFRQRMIQIRNELLDTHTRTHTHTQHTHTHTHAATHAHTHRHTPICHIESQEPKHQEERS